ncbi:MAG: hypothetical protein IM638_16765 [Bacteroidetes bacterium]|nr:hypothetical protein [Bacteroidota bacterium]
MKKSDVYEIAVKIFGIYFLVRFVELLNELIGVLVIYSNINEANELLGGSNSGLMEVGTIFITSFCHLFIGILFAWLFIVRTKFVVKLLCRVSDYEETVTFSFEKRMLFEISLVITGLLLIVWTLPDLVFQIVNYFEAKKDNIIPQNGESSFIYASLIKLLFGFVAVVYAGTVSNVIANKNTKTDSE